MESGDWLLLNDLRTKIFSGQDPSRFLPELTQLDDLVHKNDSEAFKNAVKIFKKKLSSNLAGERLLWLTGQVDGKIYPALDIEAAGWHLWNSNIVLQLTDSSLCKKYFERKPLRLDDVTIIEQCKDIENCSLITSLINLYRTDKNKVKVQKLGRHVYYINMAFNGSLKRLLTVDVSQIPTAADGTQLSVKSGSMTVKIVEAAYMLAFYGSYSTEGSNAAVDTYRLAGFYPEVVVPQHYNIKSLIKIFNCGYCVLAAGTGLFSQPNELNLLSNHDYAIVKIDEKKETLFIRDPLDHKHVIELNYETLIKFFGQLYLNWDTSKLFRQEQILTFFYRAEKHNIDRSIYTKPIFELNNSASIEETVWILLETHITGYQIRSEKQIAYLQEITGNFESYEFESPSDACDIGLQMIKIILPANSKKYFFCHSSKTLRFTVHLKSVTKRVVMKRYEIEDRLSQFNFESEEPIMNSVIQCSDQQKSTFQLRLNSPKLSQKFVDIAIYSKQTSVNIKYQIFEKDDYEFKHPLANNEIDHHQAHYINSINYYLSTNTNYIIKAATSKEQLAYPIGVMVSKSSSNDNDQISVTCERIFLQYGELPYHNKTEFHWDNKTQSKKFTIVTSSNVKCFIRLMTISDQCDSNFNLTISDVTTNQIYWQKSNFNISITKNIVAPNVKLPEHASATLVVERIIDGMESHVSSSSKWVLLVGSSKSIAIDER